MLLLEASVVVYLLQGYVSSGKKVRLAAAAVEPMCWLICSSSASLGTVLSCSGVVHVMAAVWLLVVAILLYHPCAACPGTHLAAVMASS